MKLVRIDGSARTGGHSQTMAAVLEAEFPGWTIDRVALGDLAIKGCQGCKACKTRQDQCAIQDGLTPVLDLVAQAEVTVLGAPVYFADVSAQAKALIDRLYWTLPADYLVNPLGRLGPGKTLVLLLSQGHPDPVAYAEVGLRYARVFRRMGFDAVHVVRGTGLGDRTSVLGDQVLAEEIRTTAWVVRRAYETGQFSPKRGT